MYYLVVAENREHREAEWLEGFYRKLLTPMIEYPRKRYLFRIVLWGCFFLACSMFYTKWVAVKMLPLDNKPEFSVVLDMPEGTALPVTANMTHRIAETVRKMPEVTAVQIYAGTARPFDFNGMVRHYYLRQDPWQAEVQVQLLHKSKRDRSSHELAVEARREIRELVKGSGARVSIVEMPPGPPVLQSVVAEVHGPSSSIRHQVTRDLTEIFKQTETLRDIDNYLREPYQYWRFHVDTEKAVRRGISVDSINRNLSMALGGMVLGDVKQRAGHEPVNIVIQVPLAERSQVTRLGDLPVQSQSGVSIPLRELGRFEQVQEEDIIYHKDLRSVEYVVADVGGELAAPVYGMFQVQDILAENYTAPDGVKLDTFWFGPPKDDTQSSIEWTGEWTVTFETFRDMGAAFMVALVLIYVLVVWEFGNFKIPALIMAPIPLTLLGIIPMHAIMGAEFTATSMIGWIALAGIIVRNSILLVDYSVHEVQRGIPVAEAVIRACKTRTRPILITALALVCGSSVIFTDPIFQGMAISLASGVMVSTILTLIVIPLGCIKSSKALCEVAALGCAPGSSNIIAEMEVATPKPVLVKTPILLIIWGKIATVLLMLFYAIRGIFLLIGQLFKRKPAPPPPASPAGGTPTPPPPSTPPSAPQGGVPDVGVQGAAARTETEVVKPIAETAVSPGSQDQAVVAQGTQKRRSGVGQHGSIPTSSGPEDPVVTEPAVEEKREENAAAVAESTGKAPVSGGLVMADTAPEREKPVQSKSAKQTTRKKVALKKSAAIKKSTTKKSAPRKPRPKPAVRRRISEPRPSAAPPKKQPAATAKDPEVITRDEKTAPASGKTNVTRKDGRRGIRLRARDTGGME